MRERGRQRTDSTHVLTAVHALNRISCVGQTFRHTLNVLASVAPDWFLEKAKPEWVERYSKRVDLDHQVPAHKHAERELYEKTLAADGLYLLRSALAKTAPAWLHEVPAVQTLWRVWIQNFTVW